MKVFTLCLMGLVSSVVGIICTIPGGLLGGGFAFWKKFSENKFTNKSRVKILRLARSMANNQNVARTLFWVLRGLRFIYVLFKSCISFILGFLFGLLVGMTYGTMKAAYIISEFLETNEYDTV